jgi:hypothetical protein
MMRLMITRVGPKLGDAVGAFRCPTRGCRGKHWRVVRTEPIPLDRGGGIGRTRRCLHCGAAVETVEQEALAAIRSRPGPTWLFFSSRRPGHVGPYRLDAGAEGRRIELLSSRLASQVDVLAFAAPKEVNAGVFEQTVTLRSRQPWSRGDVEQIFSLGVRAMEEQRSNGG